MHLLVRETRSLDEGAPALDLGHGPADIVFLSFSDADLASWSRAVAGHPAAHGAVHRHANLAHLRHPLSADLYLEHTLSHARCVVIRLIGGVDYWRYGIEETAALCRARRIPLAILPADGRPDPALAALSTMPGALYARLDACLGEGGAANLRRAVRLAEHIGGFLPDDGAPAEPMPPHGVHTLDLDTRPLAAIVLYRSHILSDDFAPITALARALNARGLAVGTLFVGSLKAPETADWVARTLQAWTPVVVLNATGFSARQDGASPLDAAKAPVLQTILAGSGEAAWQDSARGLSPADLAMQVVLPELDGRLSTAAISFKRQQDGLTRHAPHDDGIALAADRAAAWARLSGLPRSERRVAIVLSDYPGLGGQRGHAVGLDTFASLSTILAQMAAAGYQASATSTAQLTNMLCQAPASPFLTLAAYSEMFAALPDALQRAATEAWGEPGADSAVTDGRFTANWARLGHITIAIQPERGDAHARRASYHDPVLPPRHAFIAFHLWLRAQADALVHLGTHGSLEWLPGKAAALSPACWPRALTGGLPVIYPFIVNNPGEAAAAKRRIGAVTIGHLTPPLRQAGLHGESAALETMIDEYAAADGLDSRRTRLLRTQILARAGSAGLLAESGADPAADDDDALARLDAYLCDVKDLQIRDGLHVYGDSASPLDPGGLCAAAERLALLAALDARFVQPGPAGAPSAGRMDVLPTGRNLTGIDPRAVPTRSAMTLAAGSARDLLQRYRQDHGEDLRTLVLNVWGTATMRTGGEDIALALTLVGATPVWDAATTRVNGFEILPLALLDRPRVDVTLRISGLFRDAFATQVTLFDAVAQAVAARDEAADFNPLAGRPGPRIFGPAAGTFGIAAAAEAGTAWLAASSTAYSGNDDGVPSADRLAERIRDADAYLQQQDHSETDLLDSGEYASHQGGFAAAATALGRTPVLYHQEGAIRSLPQQIARVVRSRAANPAWIAGMMRHGYRGAAEITRAIEPLTIYAASLPVRFDRQFDLLYDATLANPEVASFLRDANQHAHHALVAAFDDARRRGLWHSQRNDFAA